MFSALGKWGYMKQVLTYLVYWRHSRGKEKGKKEKNLERDGVFTDVNGIGRPKAVISVPILLGHYRQLLYTLTKPRIMNWLIYLSNINLFGSSANSYLAALLESGRIERLYPSWRGPFLLLTFLLYKQNKRIALLSPSFIITEDCCLFLVARLHQNIICLSDCQSVTL